MSTKSNVALKDYYDMLQKHDWFYYYSDDSRVWNRGQLADDEIVRVSKLSKDHTDLYNKYQLYVHNRFNNDTNHSKPEEPK